MPLEFGTAVHAALEQNDIEYKATGNNLPIESLYKIFEDSLLVGGKNIYELQKVLGDKPKEKRVEEDKGEQAKLVDKNNWEFFQQYEFDEHLQIGKEIITEYIADIKLRAWYDPLESEKEFEVTTAKSPVTFMGFIDFLSKQGHIVDRKTSKSAYKVKRKNGKPVINPKTGNMIFDGDWIKKLQLIMYAIWYRKEHGKVENGLMFDIMIKDNKGKSRLQVVDVIITEQEIQRAIVILDNVKQGIENANFRAAPGIQCRWCDYREGCTDKRI